ncbi:MAG TPA: MG2 domain-containing protein, partial [Leptospiraceae bacterium]|nr:MG2 domain-containing protein [Leptospiraceae bacterium]
YQYKAKNEKNILVVASGLDGSNAFSETGKPKSYLSEKNKFFIYTERPVYRVGDSIFFKIIGKKSDGKFLPDARVKLNYKITSPDGETIETKDIELDDWGTYSGEFISKNQDALGEYGINVSKDKSELSAGSAYFYIEQYRKPEYKVEVTPAENAYVNGETAEFKVEAKYFFGAPLANANMSFRIYENKLRDTNTTYWWEEEYEANTTYNQIRMEGDKELNENGLAVLKYKLGNYPYDREITLEATVTDKSNVSITSRKTITVGRGKFYIKINPVNSFFYTKDKKEFEIKTLDYEGKPVSANVTLQFFPFIWKPWQRVYMHADKPVFIQKISTDEKGIYKLELNNELATAGEFDIVATSQDSMQNQITASRVVWLYSGTNDRLESKFKNIELTLDKNAIDKPGEITVLLKSKFVDNFVCVTLEGRDIYDRKVVKMEGNLQAVKLNIKPEYAPNLFITATMQKNRALYTTSQSLEFPHVDTRVMIKVKTDKEKYLPRETIKVEITAQNEEGKPIEGDFSLGAVDEAIYQIRPDHTRAMNPFFYSKISNWVSTNYSYPMTLLAGTTKDGKDLIREVFKDTAFWKPDLRTDKNGKAFIQFEVPDNLTEWRLTLRGHDKEGRVGETVSSVLVTQDLVARIAKPRFFTESDRISVIGIVNNNSKEGMPEIKTEMLVNEKEIKPEEKDKISLPPFGASKQHYPLVVPETDSMKLQFRASANEKAKDAILHKVPIYKNGIAFKISEQGDMTENTVVQLRPAKPDKNISAHAEELSISLNPSPVEKICAARDFLADYPYGCVEQTLNRFLPAVEIWNLNQAKKLPSIKDDPNLEKKVIEGIKRLSEMQNDDGSWGWWSGDVGNEFLTAYVMYGMKRVSVLHIDQNAVQKGKTALTRMLSNPQSMEDDARAYLLFVGSLYDIWSPSSYEKLIKKDDVSAYAKSFLIRALVNLSPKAFTKDGEKIVSELKKQIPILVERLKSSHKNDKRGIYYDHSEETYYSWQGGSTEVSAHVLSALLEADDKSAITANLMSSIQKRGSGGYWNSTKETATVISAITSYLDKKGANFSSKGKVDFSLNGKPLTSIEYDTSKSDRELKKMIPIKESKDEYTIAATGTKSSDLSFDLSLKGFLKFKDNDTNSQATQTSIDSLRNGLKVKRGFYSIKRIRDLNNQEYFVPHPLVQRKLQVGEELLVKVQFKADKDYEYLMLEDFLPSGFEVTKTDAYEGRVYYTHSERRDEKMVFFFNKLKKGKVYELAYMIRAELPGVFNVKPARMECMYAPEIQGFSLPEKLTVEK